MIILKNFVGVISSNEVNSLIDKQKIMISKGSTYPFLTRNALVNNSQFALKKYHFLIEKCHLFYAP